MAKKPKSTPAAVPEGELAQAVDRLTEMLGIVDDTLAQIRNEMSWLISNKDDFRPAFPVITRMPKKASDPQWGAKLAAINKPETLGCYECDAPSPDSLACAIDQGWAEITPEDGGDCNYRGLCPACFEREYEIPPNVRGSQHLRAAPKQEPQPPAATSGSAVPSTEQASEATKHQDTLFSE